MGGTKTANSKIALAGVYLKYIRTFDGREEIALSPDLVMPHSADFL